MKFKEFMNGEIKLKKKVLILMIFVAMVFLGLMQAMSPIP